MSTVSPEPRSPAAEPVDSTAVGDAAPSGIRVAAVHGAVAALIFVAAYVAGCASVKAGWFTLASGTDAAAHQAHFRLMAQREPLDLFGQILATNLKATAALLVVGAATAGLFSVAYTAIFAAHIAIATAPAMQAGVPTGVVAAFLVPHGVVELPALWLAAGVGLRAGVLFCRYLSSGRLPSRAAVHQLAWVAAFSLTLIPVAAVVEAYVTPAVGLWMLGPG